MNRGKFEGVLNILSFNRHLYIAVFLFVLILSTVLSLFTEWSATTLLVIQIIILLPVFISLGVSHYIYDRTNLYSLPWLDAVKNESKLRILNVNAGFDETTGILKSKFDKATIEVVDFYNPDKHTEISIERARRLRPSHHSYTTITTSDIQLETGAYDIISIMFAAHEIRNDQERIQFFKEVNRILDRTGSVYVTEHLRDSANFFVYTIGFFHFFSLKSWIRTYSKSGFQISNVIKTTPFVTTFELKKI